MNSKNSKFKSQGTISSPEKSVSFKDRAFVKTLQEQNFAKLSKSREKFVDDLFPPEQKSINSGKLASQSEVKQPEIPSFIKVVFHNTETTSTNNN